MALCVPVSDDVRPCVSIYRFKACECRWTWQAGEQAAHQLKLADSSWSSFLRSEVWSKRTMSSQLIRAVPVTKGSKRHSVRIDVYQMRWQKLLKKSEQMKGWQKSQKVFLFFTNCIQSYVCVLSVIGKRNAGAVVVAPSICFALWDSSIAVIPSPFFCVKTQLTHIVTLEPGGQSAAVRTRNTSLLYYR